MLYKLVNPSDAYTFEAKSREVALAVCGLLGDGHYGILLLDENEKVIGPGEGINFDQKPDDYFTELTGLRLEEVWDRHEDMADSLESVLIGNRLDNMQGYVLCHGESERRKFAEEWHDRHRTSMVDIRAVALALAEWFRMAAAAVKKAELACVNE